MSDDMRLVVVLTVAAFAAVACYVYWARDQKRRNKTDAARHARRVQARGPREPEPVAVPRKRQAAAGFGRR
jgi:hypothetical protein